MIPVRFDSEDLDPTIDPRVDLDGHVNARWRLANPVPPDRSCWDTFSILSEVTLQAQADIAQSAACASGASGAARVVGILWRSGMDLGVRERAGLDATGEDLAAINALTSTAGVVAWLDGCHARGEALLFAIDVAPDFRTPTTPLAYIDPVRLPLARDDYAAATDVARRRRRLCVAYFAGLLRRAGCEPGDARMQAHLAFDLDAALAAVLPANDAHDVAARYLPLPATEALARIAPLSLHACFEAADLVSPTHLSLAAPGFHAGVAQLLYKRPVAHWQAWLRVRCLDRDAPDLDADLRCRHQRFHGRTLRGQRVAPPIWKQILSAVDRDLGDAMAQLYVERYVAPGTRPRMQALFERLRDALRARIGNAAWLSDSLRARAHAKADAMRANLVAPATWPDWRAFATPARSYQAHLRAARAHALRRRLQRLHGLDADAWSMPAHRVNARYDPHRNCIEIPAGILQPPFFDIDAEAACHYGGIGAVMAHEMSHGFDDQGRRFDAEGRFGGEWPEPDRRAYAARAAAVTAYFDSLSLADGGPVDGRRTLGENIADLAGLAIAWDAFVAEFRPAAMPATASGSEDEAGSVDAVTDGEAPLEVMICSRGLTPPQRFFVAWAVLWRQTLTPEDVRLRAALDRHAPAALRANMAAEALPAFREAFGTTTGAPRRRGISGVW